MAQRTSRTQRAEDLMRFLRTIQKPDRPLEGLGERTSLVESGLIDSLAVLEIVTYLEDTYGLAFVERGVNPDELSSIGGILDLIDSEIA
jgi:acyl carrier protein